TGELDLGAAAQVAAGGADLDAVGARLHHPGAGPGAPVLQLGGGDVDAHALRGSRLELDIGEALELARCAGDPRAGDGHVGLHDLAPGALARVAHGDLHRDAVRGRPGRHLGVLEGGVAEPVAEG